MTASGSQGSARPAHAAVHDAAIIELGIAVNWLAEALCQVVPSVVAPVATEPLVWRPTATQCAAETQSSRATIAKPDGPPELVLQLWPPSLERTKGTAPPVEVAAPVTAQLVVFAHETVASEAVPEGSEIGDQLAPAFVVRMASALALGLKAPRGLGPTATQVVAEEHEIEKSCWTPPGTPTWPQVTPPSWLTTTEAPTAMQVVELGQATAPKPPAPLGTLEAYQVEPPSVDLTRAP